MESAFMATEPPKPLNGLIGLTGVPEHDAIVQCYAKLVNGIQQDPKVIRDKLFPRLSPKDREYLSSDHPSNSDKARRIVDTVSIQVQLDHGTETYNYFVKALRGAGSWIKDVVDDLVKTCDTLQVSTPEYLTLTECKTILIELQKECLSHKHLGQVHFPFSHWRQFGRWSNSSAPEDTYQNLSRNVKTDPSQYYNFLNDFTLPRLSPHPGSEDCQQCIALMAKKKLCSEKLKNVYAIKQQDQQEKHQRFMMNELKETDSQHRPDLWMWRMSSEKWDQQYRELLKQETQWKDNAFLQSKETWEYNEEELRQREQQSIKWDQLTEDQKRQYEKLVHLAERTTEVTDEEIKKTLEVMSKVKLYKEKSLNTQKYLEDLNSHLNELNLCKTKIQSFKEGLERHMKEMDDMIKNLEAQGDPALKSALEECQRKYDDCSKRLEECQRQLDEIDLSAKTYGEEQQRALKNLSDVQQSLSESATELKQFSDRVFESQQELSTRLVKKAGAYFDLNATMFLVVFIIVFILTRITNAVFGSVAGNIITGLFTALCATMFFVIGIFGGTQDVITTSEEQREAKKAKDKLDHIANDSRELTELVKTARQEIDKIGNVVCKATVVVL